MLNTVLCCDPPSLAECFQRRFNPDGASCFVFVPYDSHSVVPPQFRIQEQGDQTHYRENDTVVVNAALFTAAKVVLPVTVRDKDILNMRTVYRLWPGLLTPDVQRRLAPIMTFELSCNRPLSRGRLIEDVLDEHRRTLQELGAKIKRERTILQELRAERKREQEERHARLPPMETFVQADALPSRDDE